MIILNREQRPPPQDNWIRGHLQFIGGYHRWSGPWNRKLYRMWTKRRSWQSGKQIFSNYKVGDYGPVTFSPQELHKILQRPQNVNKKTNPLWQHWPKERFRIQTQWITSAKQSRDLPAWQNLRILQATWGGGGGPLHHTIGHTNHGSSPKKQIPVHMVTSNEG